MIVVDVGCVPHGKDESTEKLIRRFNPSVYYGFDPLLNGDVLDRRNGTRLVFQRRAAWIRDGSIPFVSSGITSSVVVAAPPDAEVAECFDFSEFVSALPRDDVVVKIDAEGAEYALLDKLHATGADGRVSLLLVEWHDHLLPDADALKARLLTELRCPIEEWA